MVKQILQKLGILSALVALGVFGVKTAYAANTPTFNQTINEGSLGVDIVDADYATVASPAVDMEGITFSFACQDATGTLGTTSEQIYVQNPDAADAGWDVSLAASDPTDLWDGASHTIDFNSAAGSGCTNGQMTVDASAGTLAKGQCASCDTDNVSQGSSAAFIQGTTDSITLLTGAASSDDIGDWTLQGVSIGQKIPAEKPADSYSIDMVLSIVAKS